MSLGSKSGVIKEKDKGEAGKYPECSSVVANKDHGLACEIWFHIACVGIDVKVYEGLKQLNNLHWFCNNCNHSVDKFLNDIARIEKQQTGMNKDIEDMKVKVEKILLAVERWRQDSNRKLEIRD